jgi:hypothetical protein
MFAALAMSRTQFWQPAYGCSWLEATLLASRRSAHCREALTGLRQTGIDQSEHLVHQDFRTVCFRTNSQSFQSFQTRPQRLRCEDGKERSTIC